MKKLVKNETEFSNSLEQMLNSRGIRLALFKQAVHSENTGYETLFVVYKKLGEEELAHSSVIEVGTKNTVGGYEGRRRAMRKFRQLNGYKKISAAKFKQYCEKENEQWELSVTSKRRIFDDWDDASKEGFYELADFHTHPYPQKIQKDLTDITEFCHPSPEDVKRMKDSREYFKDELGREFLPISGIIGTGAGFHSARYPILMMQEKKGSPYGAVRKKITDLKQCFVPERLEREGFQSEYFNFAFGYLSRRGIEFNIFGLEKSE